jgi:peroxiredoxin
MKKSAFFAILLLAIAAASANAQAYPQPDFSATTMDGKKVSLSELRGKVVVLNLWFINCPNCLAEIKELNQLVAQYKNNKDVVFLAPASSKKAELVKFLQKNPFAFEVIPDAGTLIISRFGKPDKNGNVKIGFPMHLVVDRQGMVTVRMEGTKGIKAVRDELAKQFGSKAD